MTERDSNISRRSNESLTETPLRATELAGESNDPGAGAGSVDEAHVAEKGAGDKSSFDASDAYTGLDEDDALDKTRDRS